MFTAARTLAGPILSVAGTLAAASGSAAVVLYRLNNIVDQFNQQGKELSKKIEVQGKELTKKIEDQGKELTKKIEDQGKELTKKIDKQGEALTELSKEVKELGKEVANIKGRLTPYYPQPPWGPPPVASFISTRAANRSSTDTDEGRGGISV